MKNIKDFIFSILLLSVAVALGQTSSDSRSLKFDYGWKFQLGDYPNAQLPDFNDVSWRQLDLPHDWSIEGDFNIKNAMGNDGGYLPSGIGWYRKTLDITEEQFGKKLNLYFEGVYMNSEVFLNGVSLGVRPYGFSSFFYDISSYVKKGRNIIAVRVDNSQQKNCRWYTGSGIYRHVWLIQTNALHLVHWGTAITTPEAETKRAKVLLKIRTANQNNTIQNTIVEVLIFDKKNRKVGYAENSITIEACSEKESEQEITIKAPLLWSPESPDLYRAEINLKQNGRKVDQFVIPFGIRKMEYSAAKGFVLNNREVNLNGGCVHHDNGALGAAAYDRAEFRKAELLKQAGFNAVRTSHNPPSEAFLHACDSIGLLVIDETFDGWKVPKNTYDYSVHFDKWWENDTRTLILRDRNHPSIIMWSIGNEIIERKSFEAVQTANKIAALIKRHDQTRPVTSAMTTWDKDWEIFDPLMSMHDVAGYNYQMHHAEADHERVPARVIVQTESYPRDAFNNWKAVNDHKYIIGDFVWTAMDYIGESGIGRYFYEGDVKGEHWERELYPWHGAYCGDIDLIGWRKPISHYREILYTTKKRLFMSVKEPNNYFGNIKETLWSVWPTWESWNWPGHEGRNIDVEVYSNYPSVRLYRDGRLVGEKSTTRAEEFKAIFQLQYKPGELKAVGILNGREVESQVLKSAGEAAMIMAYADRKVLKSDAQDLSYIQVDLTDQYGVRSSNAENLLKFEIKGPGTIAGIANANMKDTDSYSGNLRKSWKGQALVIVKSGHEKGSIELKVTSEGLKPALINLTVK